MAGSFFGALLNGVLVKWIGFRWSFMIGMVMMIAFPFISIFGTTVELQVVGQALCGYVFTPLLLARGSRLLSVLMLTDSRSTQPALGHVRDYRASLCFRNLASGSP